MSEQYMGSSLYKNYTQALREAQAAIKNPPPPSTSRKKESTASETAAASSKPANTANNQLGATNTGANANNSAATLLAQQLLQLQQGNPLAALGGLGNSALPPGVVLMPVMLPWPAAAGANGVPLPPGLQPPVMMGNNIPLMPLSTNYMPQAFNGFGGGNTLGFNPTNIAGANFGLNGVPANDPLAAASLFLENWLKMLTAQQPAGGGLFPGNPANGLTTGFTNGLGLQGNGLSNTAANGRGLPVQNRTAMQQSLTQLLQGLQQLVESLNNGNTANVSGNLAPSRGGLPLPQPAPINQLVDAVTLDSVLQNGPKQQALFLLAGALQAQNGELNQDGDAFAVSQKDLEQVKAALQRKQLSETDVLGAFQWMFLAAPPEAQDEVSVLFSQAVDQEILPASSLLRPTFLDRLNDAQYASFMRGLANSGLTYRSGKVNTDLTGWLLQNVNSKNASTANAVQDLALEMQDVWRDERNTPEGKQITTVLEGWLGLPSLPAAPLPATTTTATLDTTTPASTATTTVTGTVLPTTTEISA